MDTKDLQKYFVLAPVWKFLMAFYICLVHCTNFWIPCYIVCPIFGFVFYFNSLQHEILFEYEDSANFHFILMPNFILLVQAVVCVCYITELNRVMIWFHANENKNICKFYEETIQDKIPLILVSNNCESKSDATKDESASTEKTFFVNPLKSFDIE